MHVFSRSVSVFAPRLAAIAMTGLLLTLGFGLSNDLKAQPKTLQESKYSFGDLGGKTVSTDIDFGGKRVTCGSDDCRIQAIMSVTVINSQGENGVSICLQVDSVYENCPIYGPVAVSDSFQTLTVQGAMTGLNKGVYRPKIWLVTGDNDIDVYAYQSTIMVFYD